MLAMEENTLFTYCPPFILIQTLPRRKGRLHTDLPVKIQEDNLLTNGISDSVPVLRVLATPGALSDFSTKALIVVLPWGYDKDKRDARGLQDTKAYTCSGPLHTEDSYNVKAPSDSVSQPVGLGAFGVVYQISSMSDICITIHYSSKIIVRKWQ